MTDPEVIANWAKIVDVALKAIALLCAALSTWFLFIKKRQRFPRAKVRHDVESRLLTDKKRLIRLSVTVENAGEVLVEIASGEAWLQRVLPLVKDIADILANKEEYGDLYSSGSTEVRWPLIGEHPLSRKKPHEIEPGECDSFDFDFIIDSSVTSILAYSHINNQKKERKEIGWNCSTLHDLDHSENQMTKKDSR